MSLRLYMDHHVHAAVTEELRRRGVDCITTQDDNTDRSPDDMLLDRAAALGRVVVTNDRDFLVITSQRLQRGISFAGVIYAPQLRMTIGRMIGDLELLATASDAHEMMNQIIYLPL